MELAIALAAGVAIGFFITKYFKDREIKIIRENTSDKAYLQWSSNGRFTIYNNETSKGLQLGTVLTWDGGDVVTSANVGSSGVLASSSVYVSNVYASDWIRVSGTDRRVLHAGNYSSYVPAASQIIYIDVYGQGSTGSRGTANSWAQSAVSIPNNCLYIVRYNYSYTYYVNNGTATGYQDRRAAWYKNSSGTTYWAGIDAN